MKSFTSDLVVMEKLMAMLQYLSPRPVRMSLFGLLAALALVVPLQASGRQISPLRSASGAKASAPTRLEIPAIGLDMRTVSVGLDKRRYPIVPKYDIGWYNFSAMPGQGNNIVFWGHVLRFKATPKIPAPFARIHELKRGALIVVTNRAGEQHRYKVTRSVQVTPDQIKYVLPTGKEQITLVSCIGDNVVARGNLTKKYRLITIAEPVK